MVAVAGKFEAGRLAVGVDDELVWMCRDDSPEKG